MITKINFSDLFSHGLQNMKINAEWFWVMAVMAIALFVWGDRNVT